MELGYRPWDFERLDDFHLLMLQAAIMRRNRAMSGDRAFTVSAADATDPEMARGKYLAMAQRVGMSDEQIRAGLARFDSPSSGGAERGPVTKAEALGLWRRFHEQLGARRDGGAAPKPTEVKSVVAAPPARGVNNGGKQRRRQRP